VAVTKADWDQAGMEGLAFFGKMSASISHEIKNYLAIINEKAGLCGDLFLMADKGQPLDTEMIKESAQNIVQQVKRADGVVKNLNRLAHSIDEPWCDLDLNETVELLVTLCHRFAASNKVNIEMSLPLSAVHVESSPFFLMDMLFYYLDQALSQSKGGEVQVLLKDDGGSAEISIVGSGDAVVHSTEAVRAAIPVLQERLGIDVNFEGKEGKVVIRVPKTFG
jgi:C4-dicarboxylate-specific signal transduction histidine kinase